MHNQLSVEQWSGCSDTHIDDRSLSHGVHRDVVDDFKALQQDAKVSGIDLQIASGFRDYYRQRDIWNAKARGQRVLLSDEGEALDLNVLNEWQRVQAILRWSALPGSSRHHWGGDLDVYDASAMPAGYELQLTPQEYSAKGIFSRLVGWLPEGLERHGFYRPYAEDRGGTAPEAWHISHRETAEAIRRHMSAEQLRLLLVQRQDLELLDCVLAHWQEISERYLQPAWD